MAIDKAIDYVTRQMLKQGSKPVEQAGVMNYMPSEMVTVPKIAKSSPNTPTAKLAYITPEEENILVDLNLYGSLKGKPNKGPGGIPSLEGDFGGGFGGFKGGGDYSAAERGDKDAFGKSPEARREAQDIRSSVIAAGAGQRVNPGFFDSRNVVSPVELARAKAFNPSAFGAVRGGGIGSFLSGGGFFGNLIRGLGRKLGFGKNYNQPTYDMSKFSGLPLGGSAAFQNLDIRDKFNRKNNFEIDPRLENYLEFQKLSPDAITFEEYLENIDQAPKGIMTTSSLPANNFGSDINPLFKNMIMETGLNKIQKQGLKAKKGNVMSGLFSVKEALDSIKPFDDKEDPATLEDVKKFYGLEV
tara:strand:+ start:23 stop:1090 length:1068 start_codon:yes stop_codon:yes gene_type:complete